MCDKYNTLNADDIATLCEICPGRVTLGESIGEDYSHDELSGIRKFPDALVSVMTAEEISAIMKLACKQKIPVVVRGSGTGLVGGAVAVCGGIMLDMSGMNKILSLDNDNLTVTVQPGVLLMELAEFAQSNGYLYPPDPGEKSATIGGNISTNAGGMRAVKYGVTRDYVRSLLVVLPTGEIMRLGGNVVKNSSGYSIKDLIIGSEGTLGIIAEATLKLVPAPACSVSLLVPFDSMDSALDCVPVIMRSNTSPTAVEYMAREVILYAEKYLGRSFPDAAHEAYLLLTFDGESIQTVQRMYYAASELCIENGAADALIVDTDERRASVWGARGAFLEAILASAGEMDECDVVVPKSEMAGFIKYTHEISESLGIRIPSFGHVGDGNLHVYICRDGMERELWENKLGEAFDLMYARAKERGGLVSGEHGIGWAKKKFLTDSVGEEQISLMRKIKSVFDPYSILNPEKII